jgi:hypothetical protein
MSIRPADGHLHSTQPCVPISQENLILSLGPALVDKLASEGFVHVSGDHLPNSQFLHAGL